MESEKELSHKVNNVKIGIFKKFIIYLFGLVNKSDNEKELITPVVTESKLFKEVNNLLKIEDLDTINELLTNGYVFNKNQDKAYHDILSSKMSKKFLTEIVNEKKYMSDDFLIDTLLSFNRLEKYDNYSLNNTDYKYLFNPEINNFLEKKFKNKNFTEKFKNTIITRYNESFSYDLKKMKELKNRDPNYVSHELGEFKESHSNYIFQLGMVYFSEIKKTMKRNDLLELLLIFKPNNTDYKKAGEELINHIDYISKSYPSTAGHEKAIIYSVNKNYSEFKDNSKISYVLENIQKYLKDNFKEENESYITNLINQITPIQEKAFHQIKKNMETMENIVPEECQKLLNEIECHINYCLNHKDKLNQEELFLVNKLLNEDVPKDLSKYLSLHPEFRETLKNAQGKNSKEILFDSLVTVEEIVKGFIEKINEKTLTDMSVSNRKYNTYNK